MQVHHNEKMKEWIYPPPNIVLLLDLFVTLRPNNSSVDKRITNYWGGIWKLLLRDKKKICVVHSNNLVCNQITKFTSKF